MIAISPEQGQLRPLARLVTSGPHLLPPPQEQVGANTGVVPGSYLSTQPRSWGVELLRHPSTFP